MSLWNIKFNTSFNQGGYYYEYITSGTNVISSKKNDDKNYLSYTINIDLDETLCPCYYIYGDDNYVNVRLYLCNKDSMLSEVPSISKQNSGFIYFIRNDLAYAQLVNGSMDMTFNIEPVEMPQLDVEYDSFSPYNVSNINSLFNANNVNIVYYDSRTQKYYYGGVEYSSSSNMTYSDIYNNTHDINTIQSNIIRRRMILPTIEKPQIIETKNYIYDNGDSHNIIWGTGSYFGGRFVKFDYTTNNYIDVQINNNNENYIYPTNSIYTDLNYIVFKTDTVFIANVIQYQSHPTLMVYLDSFKLTWYASSFIMRWEEDGFYYYAFPIFNNTFYGFSIWTPIGGMFYIKFYEIYFTNYIPTFTNIYRLNILQTRQKLDFNYNNRNQYLQFSELYFYKNNKRIPLNKIINKTMSYGDAFSYGDAKNNGKYTELDVSENIIDNNINSKYIGYFNGNTFIDLYALGEVDFDSYSFLTCKDSEQYDPISFKLSYINKNGEEKILSEVEDAEITNERLVETQKWELMI